MQGLAVRGAHRNERQAILLLTDPHHGQRGFYRPRIALDKEILEQRIKAGVQLAGLLDFTGGKGTQNFLKKDLSQGISLIRFAARLTKENLWHAFVN